LCAGDIDHVALSDIGQHHVCPDLAAADRLTAERKQRRAEARAALNATVEVEDNGKAQFGGEAQPEAPAETNPQDAEHLKELTRRVCCICVRVLAAGAWLT
jgi:hypothetical protein